ncbi:hypothetical protein D9M71_428870 [compost metagenome]
MHHVAKAVTEDLRLDVLGVDDALFQEHFGRTEGLGGLGDHPWEVLFQFFAAVATANTTAATTGGGLEHHRVTDAVAFAQGFMNIGNVAFGAWGYRHTGGDHGAARFGLVAHAANDIGGRADELDPALGADLCQFSVFRQETIARVQGITAGFHSQVHQLARVQVTGQRLGTNAVGFVGALDVQGVPVGVGIDRYRANAHLGAGTHDPNCDFTSVGDQDFFYHWSLPKAVGTVEPVLPVGA